MLFSSSCPSRNSLAFVRAAVKGFSLDAQRRVICWCWWWSARVFPRSSESFRSDFQLCLCSRTHGIEQDCVVFEVIFYEFLIGEKTKKQIEKISKKKSLNSQENRSNFSRKNISVWATIKSHRISRRMIYERQFAKKQNKKVIKLLRDSKLSHLIHGSSAKKWHHRS